MPRAQQKRPQIKCRTKPRLHKTYTYNRSVVLRTTVRIMNINKCATELINDTPHFQLATRRKQQATDNEQDI